MPDYVNDPKYGEIIDFDLVHEHIGEIGRTLFPDFQLLKSMEVTSKYFHDVPDYMIAIGASGLSFMMLISAGEDELAEELHDNLFTLGWTEEHTGTDLLSVRTTATPMSDDPDERNYWIKGTKWIINNGIHADYHIAICKTDPDSNGPRSLSVFLIPQSSCKNHKRLKTHVLRHMVLAEFEIDGPGILIGKKGRGLEIQQRMAMPSKYQCTYVGMNMLNESIQECIDHLSTKVIFGEHPINFNNVFRQLYNQAIQTALTNFIFYRAVAHSDSEFLQFYGTMLKSYLLLRTNEILTQNLLVMGSKGFVEESTVGRDAIDSLILPVFDGHYTINTLMTAKQAKRYLYATRKANVSERLATLHEDMYVQRPGNQIKGKSANIRNPNFYDFADYIDQLDLNIDLDAEMLVQRARELLEEVTENGMFSEPDTRYKMGALIFYMEGLLAACELWRMTCDIEGDLYINGVIQQYNLLVNYFNSIISEGMLITPFLTPMRHQPLPEVDDPKSFLEHVYKIREKFTERERMQV